MKRGCTFKKEQRRDAELLLTLHFAFFVLHWRKLVCSNFGLLESVWRPLLAFQVLQEEIIRGDADS